jgi:ubiquinone/menaquinone biosynthesis C-methylase UbiE
MKKAHKTPKSQKGWQQVAGWYDKVVGAEGHYYHQNIILPNVLNLLEEKNINGSLLDLACGQGVLARHLPPSLTYWGVDAAPALIKTAKSLDKTHSHHFYCGDITKPLPLKKNDFDCATIILAIQDIEEADKALANAAAHLKKGGELILVLNHPCFRAPRQTEWGVDEANKIQYRRLNSYLSEKKIPIRTAPSKETKSPVVFSYHRPLSRYVEWLSKAGLFLSGMEEWVSDKVSTGPKAPMEDRARREFPLFLCLIAKKFEIRTA